MAANLDEQESKGKRKFAQNVEENKSTELLNFTTFGFWIKIVNLD